jgi:hypothetical protein
MHRQLESTQKQYLADIQNLKAVFAKKETGFLEQIHHLQEEMRQRQHEHELLAELRRKHAQASKSVLPRGTGLEFLHEMETLVLATQIQHADLVDHRSLWNKLAHLTSLLAERDSQLQLVAQQLQICQEDLANAHQNFAADHKQVEKILQIAREAFSDKLGSGMFRLPYYQQTHYVTKPETGEAPIW